MSVSEQSISHLLDQFDPELYLFDESVPTEEELDDLEQHHGISFPPAYRAFVCQGGHNYAGIANRILSPRRALSDQAHVDTHLLPFAENGCGDWYCWPVAALPGAPVVWWDHETQTTSDYADSFTTCLEQWVSS